MVPNILGYKEVHSGLMLPSPDWRVFAVVRMVGRARLRGARPTPALLVLKPILFVSIIKVNASSLYSSKVIYFKSLHFS